MYHRNAYILAGDQGIVVECGDDISPETATRVRSMHYAIENAAVKGIVECIPTYRSILVIYDPLEVGVHELIGTLRDLESQMPTLRLPEPIVTHVPVVYGGSYGPDLEYVAEYTGLAPEDFIQAHSGVDYLVYMLGFTAGQPYLGGMPDALSVPRRRNPRPTVPAGSVGIAGSQTGIYPVDSPGGWQLVGRTPIRLYDPARNPCNLVKAGDYVRFVPITPAEFDKILSEVEDGVYVPRVHEYRLGNPDNGSWSKDANRPSVGVEEECSGARRNKPEEGPEVETVDVFEVLEGGLQTTVQDSGRFGWQQFGVPPSGPMDSQSFCIANLLVGNDRQAAGLEITYTGPVLRALTDTVVAITGADFHPTVNSLECPQWESIRLRRGDILRFGVCLSGCRAYIGIAGGVMVRRVGGSRATYLRGRMGGIGGRILRRGDRVTVPATYQRPFSDGAPLGATIGRCVPKRYRPRYTREWVVRAVPGPQEQHFSKDGLSTFFSEPYTIGEQSDRMGVRLKGPRVEHKGSADIISDGIPPGGVQVPGSGCPIVMLNDRQTTGGYPKIACVIRADLDLLGQARIGDTVRFRPVTIEEAHEAFRRYHEYLCEVEQSIYPRYVRPRTLLVDVGGLAFRVQVEDIIEK